MDVIVERVGALDVHKASDRVRSGPGRCRRARAASGGVQDHGPRAARLRDWLAAHGVSQVVMEATGVYWKPVWHILEGDFELMLVNARHVKQVPGRKTDISDAAWLCQLAEAGLF